MLWRWCIIGFLCIATSLQAETIYKWVDKDGVVNFTDDLERVPIPYRNQIQKIESKEEKKEIQRLEPPSPPPPISSPHAQMREVDIYGRDEVWWRERVRPWREQLKEATQNLEAAQKEFNKKTVEMGRKGLVSRARYQTEAEKFDQVRRKYEAQIAEAQEMLEKLSKEAEEARANPDWLK